MYLVSVIHYTIGRIRGKQDPQTENTVLMHKQTGNVQQSNENWKTKTKRENSLAVLNVTGRVEKIDHKLPKTDEKHQNVGSNSKQQASKVSVRGLIRTGIKKRNFSINKRHYII